MARLCTVTTVSPLLVQVRFADGTLPKSLGKIHESGTNP